MRTKTKMILGATGVAITGLVALGAYARKALSARKANRATTTYGEALGVDVNVPEGDRGQYTIESIKGIGSRSRAILYRDDRIHVVGTYENYTVISWTRCVAGSAEEHYFYLVDEATLTSIIAFLSTGKIA